MSSTFPIMPGRFNHSENTSPNSFGAVLHSAIEFNNAIGLKCLLTASALDITNGLQTSVQQMTPLMRAASMGKAEFVDIILQAKHLLTDPQRQMDLSNSLLISTRQGHSQVTESLCREIKNVDSIDRDGNSALMNSAARGHALDTATLLSSGAGINITNQFNQSALTEAVAGGHVDIATTLLNRMDCDIDNANIKIGHFNFPLMHLAELSGNSNMILLLKNNGISSSFTPPNNLALQREKDSIDQFISIHNQSITKMPSSKLLIDEWQRSNSTNSGSLSFHNNSTNLNSTPIPWASSSFTPDAGPPPSMPSSSIRPAATPLGYGFFNQTTGFDQYHRTSPDMFAPTQHPENFFFRGSRNQFSALVKPDNGTAKNGEFIRPSRPGNSMHKAIELDNIEYIKKFLASRADGGKYYLEEVNEIGLSPLMLAAFKGKHDCIDAILNTNNQRTQRQLAYDLNRALFISASAGQIQSIESLFLHFENLDIRDMLDNSPLIFSAAEGHMLVTNYLIHKEAVIDHGNMFNQSALTESVAGGHLELTSMLISKLGDNAKDAQITIGSVNFGLMDIAKLSDNNDMISLLESHGIIATNPLPQRDAVLRELETIFSPLARFIGTSLRDDLPALPSSKILTEKYQLDESMADPQSGINMGYTLDPFGTTFVFPRNTHNTDPL